MKTDCVDILNKKQETYYITQNAMKQKEGINSKSREKIYEDRIDYQPSEKGLAALKMAELEETIAQTEGEGEQKDQLKAMKIARNIMRGKIVPPQDEQYLMEFDRKLYQVAKAMSTLEKQTEKVKSELEEEVNQELLNELVNLSETETAEMMQEEVGEDV